MAIEAPIVALGRIAPVRFRSYSLYPSLLSDISVHFSPGRDVGACKMSHAPPSERGAFDFLTIVEIGPATVTIMLIKFNKSYSWAVLQT